MLRVHFQAPAVHGLSPLHGEAGGREGRAGGRSHPTGGYTLFEPKVSEPLSLSSV